MKTRIVYVLAILLFTQHSQCQYNIIRVNPFKQLSETLKTHHEEKCQGEVISLQCPEGTKVGIRWLLSNYYFFQISIVSANYGSRSSGENHCSSSTDSLNICSVSSFIHFVESECQTKQNCTINIVDKKMGIRSSESCHAKKYILYHTV